GDLPWADGARYLGSDGGVLVPTTARPWPAAPLWRAALGATTAQLCALVPGHALVTDPPAPGCDPAALDRFLTADGAAASKATAAATEAVATAETGETAGGRPGSGRNAT
ncbi:hypothetical protein, partial [Streptomyces sp. FH025]|uniref:hypothetical protein n=1 Tax=Streptomyces sp. FH025 TaxID=2815937 RepID=UPI001A9D4D6D